ncbi:MAG: hypothetical protein AAB887_01915 [Patescibacteria group bacterium]
MTLSPKVWLSGLTVLIILLGTGVGYLLFRVSPPQVAGTSTPDMIKTATEVGSTDTKTFRDSAAGILKKDGLNGEGTHHLVLDSNPKNSAYLISSVIDLDEFVDKHVEVWGETFKGTKASWLMDVGRVKIIE